MKEDLALTLFADVFVCELDVVVQCGIVGPEGCLTADQADLLMTSYLKQTELTESVPSLFSSFGLDVKNYLPIDLINRMEKRVNEEWRGKYSLKELYSDNPRAAHSLVLGLIGHGVSVTDYDDVKKKLDSLGLSKPYGYFENDESKAIEAIDALGVALSKKK